MRSSLHIVHHHPLWYIVTYHHPSSSIIIPHHISSYIIIHHHPSPSNIMIHDHPSYDINKLHVGPYVVSQHIEYSHSDHFGSRALCPSKKVTPCPRNLGSGYPVCGVTSGGRCLVGLACSRPFVLCGRFWECSNLACVRGYVVLFF